MANILNELKIDHRPLFKIESIPGKGLGLVACRAIQVGKEILREDAVLKTCTMLAKEAELVALPNDKKARILQLEGKCSCDDTNEKSPETQLKKIMNRYAFNQYNSATPPKICNTLLFLTVARLNHDCNPNSSYKITGQSHIIVYAMRNIERGQEITMSYTGGYGPTESRQRQIQDQCGFTCGCQSCINNIVTQAPMRIAVDATQSQTTLLHQRSAREDEVATEVDAWYKARKGEIDKTLKVMESMVGISVQERRGREEAKRHLRMLGEKIKDVIKEDNQYGLSVEVIEPYSDQLVEKKLRMFGRHLARALATDAAAEKAERKM